MAMLVVGSEVVMRASNSVEAACIFLKQIIEENSVANSGSVTESSFDFESWVGEAKVINNSLVRVGENRKHFEEKEEFWKQLPRALEITCVILENPQYCSRVEAGKPGKVLEIIRLFGVFVKNCVARSVKNQVNSWEVGTAARLCKLVELLQKILDTTEEKHADIDCVSWDKEHIIKVVKTLLEAISNSLTSVSQDDSNTIPTEIHNRKQRLVCEFYEFIFNSHKVKEPGVTHDIFDCWILRQIQRRESSCVYVVCMILYNSYYVDQRHVLKYNHDGEIQLFEHICKVVVGNPQWNCIDEVTVELMGAIVWTVLKNEEFTSQIIGYYYDMLVRFSTEWEDVGENNSGTSANEQSQMPVSSILSRIDPILQVLEAQIKDEDRNKIPTGRYTRLIQLVSITLKTINKCGNLKTILGVKSQDEASEESDVELVSRVTNTVLSIAVQLSLREVQLQNGKPDTCENAVVVSAEMIHNLIDLLRILDENLTRTDKLKNANKSACRDSHQNKFRVKHMIVQVIGNLAKDNKQVQDIIRTHNQGLILVLNQAYIDDNEPFIREYTIVAVRLIMEGNQENQKIIREMKQIPQ